IMMEARDKGQRAQIKYDKLIINGEICAINQSQMAVKEKDVQENNIERKQGARSLSTQPNPERGNERDVKWTKFDKHEKPRNSSK
ncbi:hypothetical protein HHI36_011803, partial [Cryptolaemus montrouzieri]